MLPYLPLGTEWNLTHQILVWAPTAFQSTPSARETLSRETRGRAWEDGNHWGWEDGDVGHHTWLPLNRQGQVTVSEPRVDFKIPALPLL